MPISYGNYQFFLCYLKMPVHSYIELWFSYYRCHCILVHEGPCNYFSIFASREYFVYIRTTHSCISPEEECPQPPRYPGSLWRYADPDSRSIAIYYCLPGYRHVTGPLRKTCNRKTKQWRPEMDIVCSGNTV